MKVHVNKILTDLLGDPANGGMVMGRDGSEYVLYASVQQHKPINENVSQLMPTSWEPVVRHADYTKFIWLCGEYFRRS